MLIYKITNNINGKTYIGQTIQSLKKRYSDHIAAICKKNITVISQAIAKYGKGAFSIEEICRCNSSEELNYMECRYINEFNSLAPNGYNITSGGKTHFKHSDETKNKLSIINTGKEASNETREKISAIHRGRKQDPDWIAKRTSCRIGIKHSAATIAKISKNKGAKPFIVSTIDGANIGCWESVSQCARDLGISASHVTNCLKGRLGQHKGYTYAYVEQQPMR